MAAERLINRVIDDREHHMVQARAIIGIPDIHTGPLPYRIQAFQDSNTFCVVGFFHKLAT